MTMLVNTDWYPRDISWTLEKQSDCTSQDTNPDYEMVASQPAGHYTDRHHKYTETVCAEPSKFKFTLSDSYGDGVNGRIKVEKDGALVFDKEEHAGRYKSKTEYFGECVIASCSKFVGDDCINNSECCGSAKCGSDLLCFKECQEQGDYCNTDNDCCETGKCTGGVNPYCYRELPEEVAAAPLSTKVVQGKKVRIQLLSATPFNLLGLLVYNKSGNNIAEATTDGVTITSSLAEGPAANAITSNNEGCTLRQMGSFIEVTLASITDISAVELYSDSMAEDYDEGPTEVVVSIQNDAGKPLSYVLLRSIAGSRSQTVYAAQFRDMCNTSTDCIAACTDEECKKACGWDMGNGNYDPSLWCAIGSPDKEKVALKLCEEQVNASANQDLVVAQARRLSSDQCDSGQVEISIESELCAI